MKKVLLWLLELNERDLYCKTGTKAPVSGLYRSHSEIIALTKDERFPPVDGDFWKLVVSV